MLTDAFAGARIEEGRSVTDVHTVHESLAAANALAVLAEVFFETGRAADAVTAFVEMSSPKAEIFAVFSEIECRQEAIEEQRS